MFLSNTLLEVDKLVRVLIDHTNANTPPPKSASSAKLGRVVTTLLHDNPNRCESCPSIGYPSGHRGL